MTKHLVFVLAVFTLLKLALVTTIGEIIFWFYSILFSNV